MKANDLMIGDWVYTDDEYPKVPVTVQKLSAETVFAGFREWTYDKVKPIPITEKILLDNGFKMMNKSEMTEYCRLLNDLEKGGMICIYWYIKANRLFFEYMKKGHFLGTVILQDACVHQLQHFLRLSNIDLEIEL